MKPSLRQCAVCGALIVAALAEHHEHTHTKTARFQLIEGTVAASTTSAIVSGFVSRAEPGAYVLTFPRARSSSST